MIDLKGKVALVSGGGQGLGEQICRVLGEAGVKVYIGDIMEEKALKVAEDITKNNGEAHFLRLDVSDEESVKQTINTVDQESGKIDIVINNAGIDVTKPIEQLSVNDWDRVMGVNLRGPFLMSKFALEKMYKQKSGHILNIASTAALRAWPEASVYHASKWGVRALSHALFTEARKYNVKVTALISGGMRTPFILERFPDVPLEKLQDPHNVAETVKWVLSTAEESIVPEVMIIPMQETSWP
jgi:NAD(P)-dependent dehydrogenase (short-subunit alcohol dehydrogenase family)